MNRGGQFKGGRMVMLRPRCHFNGRENGHVTEEVSIIEGEGGHVMEVASLKEGEWSCYRGG